jgi:hypothetical protein
MKLKSMCITCPSSCSRMLPACSATRWI